MAFRIKKKVPVPSMKHVGTYALPSGSAISVHAETGKGAPRWIYSQDPTTLKAEDLAFCEQFITPTLETKLQDKVGHNRHGGRRLKKLEEKTFGGCISRQ